MTNQFSIPEGHYVDIAPVAGAAQRIHYHEQGQGEVASSAQHRPQGRSARLRVAQMNVT